MNVWVIREQSVERNSICLDTMFGYWFILSGRGRPRMMILISHIKHIEIIMFVISNEIAFQSFLHVKWFFQRRWQWRWYVITSAVKIFYRRSISSCEEITHSEAQSPFLLLKLFHSVIYIVSQLALFTVLYFKQLYSILKISRRYVLLSSMAYFPETENV